MKSRLKGKKEGAVGLKEKDYVKATVKKIRKRVSAGGKYYVKKEVKGVDSEGSLKEIAEEAYSTNDCGHACEAKGVCAVCGSFYFCDECVKSRKFECASCRRLVCPNCSKPSFFERGVRFCITCYFNGVISLALTRRIENSGR